MTAVSLKAKTSVHTGGWPAIFTNFNTDAKSCVFIKQLTSTCISTILYLRKVFSDDYFEERNFEGVKLKLLKPRRGDNYVTKIEQWLEGAFEAIEKKYLKKLMLDIQDAKSDMTLEVYTITFNYNAEKGAERNCPHLPTSDKESRFTSSNTDKNTIKLLQMCHAVTQTYSSLPSQVKLSMRLSYYDNTPSDYQPKGYMACEQVSPEFAKPARCVEFGVTATQYHFFRFINKSCLNDKFFEDLNQFRSSNSKLPLQQSRERITPERQTKAKRGLCFDNINKTTEMARSSVFTLKNKERFVVTEKVTPFPEQKLRGKNELLDSNTRKNANAAKKETSIVGQGDLKNRKVRCACLSSERSQTMFSCLGCGFLVHAECYGILHFDVTRRVRFYCHLCHQTENFKCHDKVLLGLKNSSDQQKLSVLRKVLRYCTNACSITVKRMEKIAGAACPKCVIIIVLNKMIEIGVAVIPQKKRKSYMINKNELDKNLLHYFYKLHDSSQSQNQNLSYSLRSLENLKKGNNPHNFPFKKESKELTTAELKECVTINSQISQQSCDIFC